MQIYEFRIILEGTQKVDDELCNRLFESGCDDSTIGSCDGVTHVDFHREADSMADAFASAINDISNAGYKGILVQNFSLSIPEDTKGLEKLLQGFVSAEITK